MLVGTLSPYATVTVDSEALYITGVSGATVTSCTRGYGGTIAATHSSAASFIASDPLHMTMSGYLIVARAVKDWLCSHYGCPALQYQ